MVTKKYRDYNFYYMYNKWDRRHESEKYTSRKKKIYQKITPIASQITIDVDI